MPFLVNKSPKSPTKPPKIATWQVRNLSNIPKFQISIFQNLRLSKTLKYAILYPKIAKIAHETAKIATCWVRNLSNTIPKFQISGSQNLRLSKTLKYAIFSTKIAKITHETA